MATETIKAKKTTASKATNVARASKKVVAGSKTRKKTATTAPKASPAGSGVATSKVATDFSVIETGGKQYIVSVGDVIDVELLGGDLKEGNKIVFDKVLMSDDGKNATIGNPYIKGAKVKATYIAFKKGKKLTIIRFKAKSNRDRRIGHRQKFSTVKIESLA